jgi:hypothetical protein
MPDTEPIPYRALDVVATEVTLRMPRLSGSRLLPTTMVAIRSSFEVWGLSKLQEILALHIHLHPSGISGQCKRGDRRGNANLTRCGDSNRTADMHRDSVRRSEA